MLYDGFISVGMQRGNFANAKGADTPGAAAEE